MSTICCIALDQLPAVRDDGIGDLNRKLRDGLGLGQARGAPGRPLLHPERVPARRLRSRRAVAGQVGAGEASVGGSGGDAPARGSLQGRESGSVRPVLQSDISRPRGAVGSAVGDQVGQVEIEGVRARTLVVHVAEAAEAAPSRGSSAPAAGLSRLGCGRTGDVAAVLPSATNTASMILRAGCCRSC